MPYCEAREFERCCSPHAAFTLPTQLNGRGMRILHQRRLGSAQRGWTGVAGAAANQRAARPPLQDNKATLTLQPRGGAVHSRRGTPGGRPLLVGGGTQGCQGVGLRLRAGPGQQPRPVLAVATGPTWLAGKARPECGASPGASTQPAAGRATLRRSCDDANTKNQRFREHGAGRWAAPHHADRRSS